MSQESSPGSAWTVGSLADEAAQLLSAARRWADQQQTQHQEPGDDTCRYCPLCQAISLVRKSHPEVLEQFGQTAESVLAAIRAAILSQERQWESQPTERVQRIDIDVER